MADAQFCLMAIDHWSTCMTKAEWSGWMQAIGSVVAIAAGVAGLAYQSAQQRRSLRTQKLREELDVVAEHRELLEEALAAVVRARNCSGEEVSYREYLRDEDQTARFEQIARLLRESDPRRMPSAALKVAFSLAQESMRTASEIRDHAAGWAYDQYVRSTSESDSGRYSACVSGMIDSVNRFDHHLFELRDYAGLADLDQVDGLKFLSRAQRTRMKR